MFHICRHIVPHSRIFSVSMIFQHNASYFREIFCLSGIFFRIMQPIVHCRINVRYFSLPDSDTQSALFIEQVKFQCFSHVQMQSLSVYMDHTLLFLLIYFYKPYITDSSALFILVQISDKSFQIVTPKRSFITIYSCSIRKIPQL